MRAATSFATTLVIVMSVLVVAPAPATATAVWTAEYANSLTDVASEVSLAHDGERLGMAYRLSSNAVGFSVRDAGPSPGAWHEKNAAAIPAVSADACVHLLNTGPAKWLVVAYKSATTLDVYRTIDDGVTWTNAPLTYTGIVCQAFDVAPIAAGKLGLVVCGSSGVLYRDSTDFGATWGTNIQIDDNAGNPLSSGSTGSTGCGGSVALTGGNNGQAYVEYGGPTPPCPNSAACTFWVSSTQGSDQFWTVPYYGGGSCAPSGCTPVDRTSSILTYIRSHNTIAAYTHVFPQNGDLIGLERNGACATPPNTLVFSATYLGQDNSDSNGACNTYLLGAFQKVSPATGCAGFEATQFDRVAGNAAHTFIAGMGHTTLCSGVGFEVDLKADLAAAWAVTYTDASQTKVFDVDMTASKAYAAFVDTVSGGGVKVVWSSSPTATAAAGSVADYVVPTGRAASGFSVDISGTNLAYSWLTGTHRSVATMPAQTLDSETATLDTGCNRAKGVTAGVQAVAFTFCNTAGSSTVDGYKVTETDLTTPSYPVPCDHAAPPASWNPNLHGLTGIDDLVFVIGTNDTNGCDGTGRLSYTDTNGHVGEVDTVLARDATAFTFVHDAPYATNNAEAGQIATCSTVGPFSTSTTPGRDYLLAVDQNQPTDTFDLHRSTAPLVVGSGALGGALAVGCSGSVNATALLAAQGKVYGYRYLSGAVAWQRDDLVPVARGSAESWDGRWGVVCCDASDRFVVLNMTAGNTTGTIALPGYANHANVRAMVVDSTAQSMWVAYGFKGGDGLAMANDHFVKYNLVPDTTVKPKAPGKQFPDIHDCVAERTCPPTPTPTSGGPNNGGSGGLVNTGSRLGGIIGSAGVVVLSVGIGYALTSNKRRRREE